LAVLFVEYLGVLCFEFSNKDIIYFAINVLLNYPKEQIRFEIHTCISYYYTSDLKVKISIITSKAAFFYLLLYLFEN
jgi:hypothetical protein